MAGYRDGVEEPAVEARLDVEGEDPEPRHEVGRLEARVAVDAPHSGSTLERSLDRERATDPVVDQVAIGETHVGFETLDAHLGEPRPERRHITRQADLHPEHG